MAHVYTIFVPSITFSFTAQQVITELLPAYGASGWMSYSACGGRKDRTVFATVDGVFNFFPSIELRSQFISFDVIMEYYKAGH